MSGGPEPQPAGTPLARPRRSSRFAVLGVGFALAVAAGGFLAVRDGHGTTATSGAASSQGGGSEAAATYTLLDGSRGDLGALLGKPAMVWFVAAGCASCAASIPAVAAQLPSFEAAKTRILVLGIYGAFPSGAAGLSQLASFGRSTAGPAFSAPVWTWAMASARLTAAYDPEGVPDEYFLLDAKGKVVYRNSVPVSTMPTLLGDLHSLSGARLPPRAAAASPTTADTLP